MSLLEEVPLGRYKIIAGLELRKAWLLNGILYNSEAWHSTEQTDIESLEKIDKSLLRNILGGVLAKCPI